MPSHSRSGVGEESLRQASIRLVGRPSPTWTALRLCKIGHFSRLRLPLGKVGAQLSGEAFGARGANSGCAALARLGFRISLGQVSNSRSAQGQHGQGWQSPARSIKQVCEKFPAKPVRAADLAIGWERLDRSGRGQGRAFSGRSDYCRYRKCRPRLPCRRILGCGTTGASTIATGRR